MELQQHQSTCSQMLGKCMVHANFCVKLAGDVLVAAQVNMETHMYAANCMIANGA